MDKPKSFTCVCGKTYTQQPNLARHHKTCEEYKETTNLNANNNIKLSQQVEQLTKELHAKNELCKIYEESSKALQQQVNILNGVINTLQERLEEQTKNINYLNEYQCNNETPLGIVTNYVYLLKEREFIKTNEIIYKVGMTTKENHKRFNQYPKGSILIYQSLCVNCRDVEKRVISIFKDTFKQRTDIGTEYFEGDYKQMINIIHRVIYHNY